MIYYLFCFIFPFVAFIKTTVYKNVSLFLGGAFLVLFSALRWETGTDWLPYYEDFLVPNQRHDFEPGYVLYVNLIRFFTNNYTIFLIITSLIPVYLLFKTCKNLIKDYELIVIAIAFFYSYYYLGSFFGAERRIIAIGILSFSLCYLFTNRMLKASLLIMLAATFHASALIMFLGIFIKKSKVRDQYILLVISMVAFIPLSLFLKNILFEVLKYIPGEVIKAKLNAYIDSPEQYGSLGFGGILKRSIVVVIFTYVIFKTELKNNEMVISFLKFYLAGISFYLLFSPVSAMFSVMSIYFTITEIFIWPYVFKKIGGFSRSPVFIFLLIAYLCFQSNSILKSYPELFYPYLSIFSSEHRVGLE